MLIVQKIFSFYFENEKDTNASAILFNAWNCVLMLFRWIILRQLRNMKHVIARNSLK